MGKHLPMTREQLQDIQARRRGDADVTALLLEIKRLRDVVAEAFQRGSRALGYTENPDEAQVRERFAELFYGEPVILESLPTRTRRLCAPQRRWPHMSEEREAKLLARMRRS